MGNSLSKLSKRNQRGLWVLVFLIVGVIISPRIAVYFLDSEKWSISQKELISETERMDKAIVTTKTKWKNSKSKYKTASSTFDPNAYLVSDWKKLGVSQKQADVIVKFTKRGIYSNDELQQIFVLPAELFALIKDSTYYPERKSEYIKYEKKGYEEKLKKAPSIVELNTANEQELVDLNGIGPYFAQKILEYRNKLGGFHSKSQLLEIWKMDAEKIVAFESQITVNTEEIVRLNINTATVEQLRNHPYIRWNVANSIVKMRAQRQKFNSINDIQESVLIDKELFEKLKIYLVI